MGLRHRIKNGNPGRLNKSDSDRMVIAACVGEGFSCRVMLLSLSSHWTVTVLSLEIFANMDRKMLQLSSSGSRGKQILLAVTVGPRNQSPIINIARRERPRRRNCIHIDGSSRAVEFCTLFRGVGHSTLRLKGYQTQGCHF